MYDAQVSFVLEIFPREDGQMKSKIPSADQHTFRARCIEQDAEDANREEIIEEWLECYRVRNSANGRSQGETESKNKHTGRSEERERWNKWCDYRMDVNEETSSAGTLTREEAVRAKIYLGFSRWSKRALLSIAKGCKDVEQNKNNLQHAQYAPQTVGKAGEIRSLTVSYCCSWYRHVPKDDLTSFYVK